MTVDTEVVVEVGITENADLHHTTKIGHAMIDRVRVLTLHVSFNEILDVIIELSTLSSNPVFLFKLFFYYYY